MNNQHSTCGDKKQGGKKLAEKLDNTSGQSKTQLKPEYVTMPMLPNRPKDLDIQIKVEISSDRILLATYFTSLNFISDQRT